MANSLIVYVDEPFDDSTACDLIDVFTPDGATDLFTLTNKTNLHLGTTLQDDLIQYHYYNGGFTKVGSDQFQTNDFPINGTILVAPGIIKITAFAYDQLNVDENPTSNSKEFYFYVGNNDDIALRQYVKKDIYPGIKLEFVDQIGYGIAADMLQIACATNDEIGSASSYAPCGEAVYISDFSAQSQVVCTVTAGDVTITLDSLADDFSAGDYVVINKGGLNEETTKVLSVSSPHITVTKTDNNHAIAEPVYKNCIKMWGKITFPVDFASNSAKNYMNISMNVQGTCEGRA